MIDRIKKEDDRKLRGDELQKKLQLKILFSGHPILHAEMAVEKLGGWKNQFTHDGS